jgi:Glycosyltransferase sugar-binding region containing DXD motif
MKLLKNTTDYNETIQLASTLSGEYTKQVIFHSYWYGSLNEKHLYSILSCYFFNVYKKKNNHKIVLWIENNTPNQYNTEIAKYAEIRNFSIHDEKNNASFMKEYQCGFSHITFYSDFARNLLLYNYGGVWFDLDCFFLRSFDPIFCNYEKEICLYQWENQSYPNNAIYISLEAKSEKMEKNIRFIMSRNRGWGFQEANLTYDLPLDILVLPCSWFDPGWIANPFNNSFDTIFDNVDKVYDFDNFFKGSFCYHWHNKWNQKIGETSIVAQLVKIIQSAQRT